MKQYSNKQQISKKIPFLNPLVTGGAGFIGSHLVEALAEAGAERVTILDNFSRGSRTNLSAVAGSYDVIDADITSLNWIEVLSSGDYDAIFHYAGSANIQESVSNPSYDFHANLLATFSLLDAMRTIRWEGRFIFSSSAAVYGNPARLPVCESDPVFPISPYGVSKLAAERYIAVYCRLYNLQAASLRSASVYGPRLRKQVVYDTFKKIINNPAEILIYGDGSQTRDFVYVKDAVQAALVVAEKGALRGETYNLASGKATSILELTRKIADELDASPVFNFSGDLRAGEPDKWVFDQSRLAEIGFKPKYSLSEGIRETSKWIKKIDR